MSAKNTPLVLIYFLVEGNSVQINESVSGYTNAEIFSAMSSATSPEEVIDNLAALPGANVSALNSLYSFYAY
ncbi:MAG: hypothetical protein R2798_06065 [Chitinophagales bacterium]|nr:hypothetical protein [Bacteroidota bacterium]